MKTELVYFDVFPKVVPCGRTARVCVKPRSRHARFDAGKPCYVHIIPVNGMARDVYHPDYPILEVMPEDGGIAFDYVFPAEQQYNLWLCDKRVAENTEEAWRGVRRETLCVYAVADDLLRLRPLRGNMHVHSFRSDGVEAPEVVAAWYRRAGYDFMALTDHHRYAPSLEAIEAYRDAPIDMLLFPGEEVHAPDNKIHIINFGGAYSVNELYKADPEGYRAQVKQIEDGLALPEGICKFEVASSLWVFAQIKKAGGLSILCHPNWTWWGAYNIPLQTYQFFLENIGYDALELINGGNTPAENQLQIAAWYNSGANGRAVPVGTDDSHGAVNGQWFDIGKTYVLSPTTAPKDIIAAMQKGLCCAVEQYPGESARIYGDLRLVRYFTFLHAEYFPLHDALCAEEGRLMLDYINGDADAKERLAACQGQTERLWRRLWRRSRQTS